MDNLYLAGKPRCWLGRCWLTVGISCQKQAKALYVGIWVGIPTLHVKHYKFQVFPTRCELGVKSSWGWGEGGGGGVPNGYP